ncbi:hypothetical protein KR018_002845, partial [Drosophila ironensis]
LCESFKKLFYNEDHHLTFSNSVKHSIPTTDNVPIFTKSYRYPFIHKEEVQKQIKKMLQQNIIKNSHSPWSAPVWVVPKKSDSTGEKKWRLVIDFRKLNEKTIADRYPIPNIADILDSIGKTQYFTTIDLASGFHQIEMDTKDANKTAFTEQLLLATGRYTVHESIKIFNNTRHIIEFDTPENLITILKEYIPANITIGIHCTLEDFYKIQKPIKENFMNQFLYT